MAKVSLHIHTISENRIADSVLTVYIAVPWETYKKSSNRPSKIVFLAKALAEAFVHEVAETILETSHSIACLAELAVHDGHNDKELHRGIDSRDNDKSSDVEILPMRVLCQLRLMPSHAVYFRRGDEACEFRSPVLG